MGGVKRSKKSFHNIVWSQSILTTSFGKIIGIKEPQTDSHVTVVCDKREAPTNIKDEIDIKPPTKIKCKSNLNRHTDEILQSQLIDEHILKEPQSTENEPQIIEKQFLEETASTESCDKVHGMLPIN